LTKVSVAGKTLADFPDLVKQIDREKQPDLIPENMAAGSRKKVWWKCPEGPDHKWETRTSHRTGAGSGCPYCYGVAVSITNNLEATHPDIVKQWHPSKNGNKKQSQFRAGSKLSIFIS
jgi:hypothetical protein